MIRMDTTSLSRAVDSAKRRLSRMAAAKLALTVSVASERDDAASVVRSLRSHRASFISQRQLTAAATDAKQIAIDTLVGAWNGSSPSAARGMDRLGCVLEDQVRRRFATGRIGTNTEAYRVYKKRMAKAGHMSSRYGSTPPFGVATGDFVRLLRVVLRRG